VLYETFLHASLVLEDLVSFLLACLWQHYHLSPSYSRMILEDYPLIAQD